MNQQDARQLSQRTRGNISLGYIGRVGEGENEGLYRVGIDGILSDWIEAGKTRAGSKRTRSTYTKGEQVVVASPDGDISQGVIICSINSEQYPEPTEDHEIDITQYDDGTVISYHEGTNTLEVLVAGAGIINIKCQTANVIAEKQITFDTPRAIFTGIVQVMKQIIGEGGMTVSGGSGGEVATFRGSVAVSGGDVKVDGVGVKSHTHKEQGDGNDVGQARG